MTARAAARHLAVALWLWGPIGQAETGSLAPMREWRADPAAQPYMFVSWALRPDGRAAVYVLQSEKGGPAALVYQDLSAGTLTELPQNVSRAARARDLQPRWSPDGSQLAWLHPHEGAWRLHVWRPKEGSTRRFDGRTACSSASRSGCKYGQVEWSRDSRYVYFLSDPADGPAAPSRAAAGPVAARVAEWRRLLYADPENGGVTVLHSVRIQNGADPSSILAPSGVPSDAVVADTRTGEIATLLTGANLIRLALAPDGRRMLAIAQSTHERRVRQQYVDFYLLPSASESSRGKGATRVLEHVPEGPVAWSPASDRIAFVDNGALASGDLSVLEVASGRVVNLTQRQDFSEPGEVPEVVPESARNYETPGARLAGAAALIWTPEADGVYALRRTRLAGEWRTRLWKLSLSREAVNLTEGAAFDAELPLFAKTVPVRLPTGEGAFAPLSGMKQPSPTLVRIAGDFLKLGYPSAFSQTSKAALFISESASALPEAFLLDRESGSVRALTSINVPAVPVALPRRQRIEWQAPSGETYFGHLYLKEPSGRPPLIVDVYPRGQFELPLSDTAYVGRLAGFHLRLTEFLRAGYALFTPDIPAAGNGYTCEDTARNLELALDAIGRSSSVDVDKAAIVGVSFGGWAVNCAITRSQRFRAAISVAGGADLFSTSFSPVSNVASWGIGGGQTRIGRSIWEAPDLFWQESPVSGARSVTTPLLLLHGKLDESVPIGQAAEMYTALSRLGKKVTLVAYDDADHGSVLSHPDFNRRITDWIHTHLGAP